MHIQVLEKSEVDTIAREEASDGEFYIRDDGSVWYRNELAPRKDCFVNADRAQFLRAVEALHCYNSNVVTTAIEEEQMVFVRRLAEDLRTIGALAGPAESFWPFILEQAAQGMS